MEKDPCQCNQISTQEKQAESAKDISRFLNCCSQKRGNQIGYDDRFKRISGGTKLHIAVESNGLPVSIVASCANEQHDSARFIDVIENMSDCLDDSMMEGIVRCYADRRYDTLRTSEIISDAWALAAVFHTGATPNLSCQKIYRAVTARPDL